MCAGLKQEKRVKAIGRIVSLSFMLVCVSTSAYDVGQRNSKRDLVAKPVEKEVVLTPKYSSSQILCLNQRRYGSRVTEHKCQTLAQWKQQLDQKSMRKYMIKSSGKAPGWEKP